MKQPFCHGVRTLVGMVLLAWLAPLQAKDCMMLIPALGGDAFWSVVIRGAQAAAKNANLDLKVLRVADETRRAGQDSLIQQVPASGCRALILAPDTPKAPQLVDELKNQGIITVYIDRPPNAGSHASVIGTNNYQAGQLAAQRLAQRLKPGGQRRVLRVILDPDVASTSARESGFIDSARRAGLLVSSTPAIGFDPARAAALLRPLLNQHFDGIFAPNESSTQAVLTALRQTRLPTPPVLIGFDLNQALYQALEQGIISELMVQRPFKMGFLGVEQVTRSLRGLPPASDNIDSGLVELTRSNMHDKNLLFFTSYPDPPP